MPCKEAELLPITRPTVSGGRGPKIPVGIFVTGESGVTMTEEEAHKSNPALPGVALRRPTIVFGVVLA